MHSLKHWQIDVVQMDVHAGHPKDNWASVISTLNALVQAWDNGSKQKSGLPNQKSTDCRTMQHSPYNLSLMTYRFYPNIAK